MGNLAQIGNFTEVVDGMETIVGKMYGYKYKNKNDKWLEVPKTYDQEEAFENARRAA